MESGGKGEKCLKTGGQINLFYRGYMTRNEQLKGFVVLVGSGRCFAFISPAEIFPGDHLDSVFTEKKEHPHK